MRPSFLFSSLVSMNSYSKVPDSKRLFSPTFVISKLFKLNLKGDRLIEKKQVNKLDENQWLVD